MSDPRIVLTLHDATVFRKGEYPWLARLRVELQGGESSDGQPGEFAVLEMDADDLPDRVKVTVGRGGGDGLPGMCILSLYDDAGSNP